MKLGLVAVGLSMASVGVAAADEGYPQAVVDRPLVLHPGMTEVFFDVRRSSTPDDTLGRGRPELGVLHAFGPIEVAALAGDLAELHLSLATHALTVEVFGAFGAKQNDGSRTVAQGALVGQRLHLIPGRLAVAGGAGVSLSEDRLRDATDMLAWSEVCFGFANARIEVQAHHRVALVAGLGGSVPLAHSDGRDPRSALGVGASVIVLVARWDFFVNGGLSDVTRDFLPSFAVGFSKRWGS